MDAIEMIYMKLFFSFLMIGALSFGGGYGMVSLVQETVLSNGWLSESEFMNFIAVSESTPGPLAINMATFIGSTQGGILGSLFATTGVVLPSFINAFLSGVRPCVVGMILATASVMALSSLLGFVDLNTAAEPDIESVIIFASLWCIHIIFKKVKKKTPSPILMIILSAALGIVFGTV